MTNPIKSQSQKYTHQPEQSTMLRVLIGAFLLAAVSAAISTNSHGWAWNNGSALSWERRLNIVGQMCATRSVTLTAAFDMISLTIAPWLPGECKCPHRCFYGWILCGYVCSCSRIRVGVQCDCNKPQMATHKLLVPYAQHTGPHGPKRDNTAESLTKVRLHPSCKEL